MPVRTAAQRRREAKIAFNVFLSECPSRQLLDTLSDKWVVLVLVALVAGKHRHAELARRIAGVSQKMLTQTLRMLERDGMVQRTVTPTVPVRVDYELTPLGWSLYGLLSQIRDWAAEKVDEVDVARADYDARQTEQ